MENKMEEISLQRKLEALGQNGTLIRKDGKTFLQLDCENAKELSMKWGEKLYPFTKTGKKWILELPFSTAVNYVQICVDGQEVLSPELFSEVGIFSGFLRDRIVGDEEHDGIVPKSCGQSYLKAMDDEAFNTYFHTFFRCIGDEDWFLPRFLEEDEIIQTKGVRETRRIYHGGHDWNVWRPCFADFAQMIFR